MSEYQKNLNYLTFLILNPYTQTLFFKLNILLCILTISFKDCFFYKILNEVLIQDLELLLIILYPESDNILEDSLLYPFLPLGIIFLLRLKSPNLKIFFNLLIKPIFLLLGLIIKEQKSNDHNS